MQGKEGKLRLHSQSGKTLDLVKSLCCCISLFSRLPDQKLFKPHVSVCILSSVYANACLVIMSKLLVCFGLENVFTLDSHEFVLEVLSGWWCAHAVPVGS